MGKKRKKDGEPGSEGWRVELPQAVWLLERMAAHDDPITREQVERFGRNPDGPILPDACLESRRLPDGWGIHDDGTNEPFAAATSVAVRADGMLAIAGVVRGTSTVLVGDERYEYPGKSGGAFVSHPEILGFDHSGVPIVCIRYDERSSLDAYLGPPSEHYRGRTHLDEHGWFIEKLSVLADGSVIIMRYATDAALRSEAGLERRQVLRDGVVIAKVEQRYQQFALMSDGQIIGFWSPAYRTGMDLKTEVAGFIGDEQPYIRDVQDCIVTPQGVRFIRRHAGKSGGFLLRNPESLDAFFEPSRWFENSVRMDRPYHGNLQQLPDGRWVYESRTRRDVRPCIVIGKDDEQPGFAHVTRVFPDADGRWCYWGALGRHLYKMEIPPEEVAGTLLSNVAGATR